MRGRFWFCLCVATTSWCACTAQPARTSANPASAAGDIEDYSLTQRSASQPNRGACTSSNGCIQAAAPGLVATPGRCDAESCDGDLSASGVAELRVAAQKAQDCYEAALKDQNQLEGKMLVRLRLAKGRQPCEVRVEKGPLSSSEPFVKCVIERLRETTVQPDSGCIDVALPLTFVRKEVEASPDGGAPEPANN